MRVCLCASNVVHEKPVSQNQQGQVGRANASALSLSLALRPVAVLSRNGQRKQTMGAVATSLSNAVEAAGPPYFTASSLTCVRCVARGFWGRSPVSVPFSCFDEGDEANESIRSQHLHANHGCFMGDTENNTAAGLRVV